MIPEGWGVTTLSSVTDKIGSGATPRGGAAVYTDSGTAFIRSQNVRDNRFEPSGLVNITDRAAEQLKGVSVCQGDVLLNITGDSVLRCCVVPEDILPARVSQHVAIIRVDEQVVPRFLQGFLVAPDTKSRLLAMASGGATRKAITKAQIEQIEILLPGIEEQRAIAVLLGAFDDKIAANTKLASTADRLAREVYRSIVCDAGVAPLSSTARFVNGRAFTKGATGTGRVVVRIAELNSGISGSTVYNDIAVASENVARPGDLLFAWSGSLTLHRWYRDEAIVNQHIFKVIPNVEYPMWLVNQLVLEKLDEFKSIAADKATTMGHIQRRHLDEPVRVPSRDLIAANDVHMDALWNRALVAERENLTLAATRDTLLPQLMSGKLRVKDAERILSEVA